MNSTVQEIIRRGSSVAPGARGSFEDILEALQRIRFKMTLMVDAGKVAEFVALVGPSARPICSIECPAFRTEMVKGWFGRMRHVQVPAVKKGRASDAWGNVTEFELPHGIIAYLTRECGGNVHGSYVVEVTSGSFKKETYGANPHSGAYDNNNDWAAKNAADLEADSWFASAYHDGDSPHTGTNWACSDFKERRSVPTHCTIRTVYYGPGWGHLKSWLVKTSADAKGWWGVDRNEDNNQLNGSWFTGTFEVADGGGCRFIRLVNISRNNFRNDQLAISAWDQFIIIN
jgi:hypothetical protein